MGFLSSIFKRQDPAPERSSDEALVARVRTSARRRLIGAVVLLGVGVVAFPLIFETQPRPIPVDIPIEIPRKDGQPPLALPASKPAAIAASKPGASASRPAAAAVPAKAEAPREPTAVPAVAAPTAPAVAPPAAPVVAPPAAASRPPAPKASAPAAKAGPTPEPKTEAAATAAKPTSAPKPAEEGSGRFVVQVGAFAEATAVREARAKVEKLGLATYTQVVETANGKRTRVRVGPFATREEADTAAAKLKAAGLPGAVLTL
jgi:DedD protein